MKYFDTDLGVNIDITHRCALECPLCQRYRLKRQGKKIPGQDMTIKNFKKIVEFFDDIIFCGQRSDPVHHPKFIQFLKIVKDNNKKCSIHNASSTKSKEWYIEAFKSNPDAKWVFGIDGLPEESHLYRINQDGPKLFDIMIESKKYLNTSPTWKYIVFPYNENHVEHAIQIAKDHDLSFLLVTSSRWKIKRNEKYRPNKKENIL